MTGKILAENSTVRLGAVNNWLVIGNHVIPNQDLREHMEAADCWCRPQDDGQIVIHNSLDERELYEREIRKSN